MRGHLNLKVATDTHNRKGAIGPFQRKTKYLRIERNARVQIINPKDDVIKRCHALRPPHCQNGWQKTNQLSPCALLSSHGTPNRSTKTPKPGDQNVGRNGKRTSPSSARALNMSSA